VGVRKDYGIRTLFENLNLHVGERERLGLIGPNGAGKSTLLKVLAGLEPPGAGERRVLPRSRMVLVSQEPQLDPERTVLDQVFAGSGEKMEFLRRYTAVSEALAQAHAHGGDDSALLAELGSLNSRMDQSQAWGLEQQIREVLASFEHPTIRFDHLHTRRAGQRRFVDVHMHMPPSWSLGRAAALRTSVEQALMSAVPGLRASIQLLPSDVEAHFSDASDLR
jgi:ATPase subunit of ABC transporter with duplicated ATPase domains